MQEENLLKIIEIIRNLREEGIAGTGVPTNNASSGNNAGLPPDQPPVDLRLRKKVDLRKKKYKRLPLLYKDIFRRKKNV
jgi:hypothetical protein